MCQRDLSRNGTILLRGAPQGVTVLVWCGDGRVQPTMHLVDTRTVTSPCSIMIFNMKHLAQRASQRFGVADFTRLRGAWMALEFTNSTKDGMVSFNTKHWTVHAFRKRPVLTEEVKRFRHVQYVDCSIKLV